MSYKRLPVTYTCQNPECGKEYQPWQKTSRYCSNRCSSLVTRGLVRMATIRCRNPGCGEMFQPDKAERQYCSRQCYRDAGGRSLRDDGYVSIYMPEHPAAYTSGQILEHRVVMERMIGRYLLPNETVHHINGDKADNDPGNLQLRTGRHGKGVAQQCGDCGSMNIIPMPLHG